MSERKQPMLVTVAVGTAVLGVAASETLAEVSNRCYGHEAACDMKPDRPPHGEERETQQTPPERIVAEVFPPSALPPGKQMFDLPPRIDDNVAVRATMMNRRSFIAPFAAELPARPMRDH